MYDIIYPELQVYEVVHENGEKRIVHARSDRTAVQRAGEWAQRTGKPVGDVIHVPVSGNRRAVINA